MNDYKEDPFVQTWLNGVGERTRQNYGSTFPLWLEFIKLTPTQQIEKRIQDLKSDNPQTRSFFETKTVQYKKTLEEKGFKAKTIHSYLISVRSFFASQRLHLRFRRGELKPETSREEKVIRKWLPSNEEVRALYSVADCRDRALLLVLYQSGFSEIDVGMLNVEDLICLRTQKNIYDIQDHLVIFKHREKSDVVQKTCISEEACHDIRSYLLERDNPKEGALFTSHKGKRLTTRFINLAIKKLASKSLTENQTKAFQTKSLRDSYGDSLLRADIKQQLKDNLFGHKPSGARDDYEVSPQTIYEAYTKAFPLLSINGGLQSRKDIEDMKKLMLHQTKTLGEFMTW
jgi:site-specific recombinase XerD